MRFVALFLALCSCDISYAVYLTLYPNVTNLNRKLGDGVSLQCIVEDLNLKLNSQVVIKNLSWSFIDHRTGQRIDLSSKTDIPKRFYIYKTGAFSNRLRIIDINYADEGTYECSARIDGQIFAKQFNLSLFDSIKILDAPLIQHPIQYSDAKIRCITIGQPTPEVLWFKKQITSNQGFNDVLLTEEDNGRYAFEHGGQVLVIKHFDSENDNGQYRCQISQDSTGSTKDIIITVSGYDYPKIIRRSNDTLNSLEGSEVILECEATGIPRPSISWIKDTRLRLDQLSLNYSLKNNNSQLQIFNVKPSDSGLYTCNASNAVGFQAATVSLTIVGLPKIDGSSATLTSILRGDTLNVSCFFNQTTGPSQVYWKRISDNMKINEYSRAKIDKMYSKTNLQTKISYLIIRNVSLFDSSTFQCVVQNVAGSATKNVSVIVEELPAIIEHSPTVQRSFGAPIQMFCTNKESAKVTWTWISPYGKLDSDSRILNTLVYRVMTTVNGLKSILEIYPRNSDDYGNYTCKAQSQFGIALKTLTLLKTKPPAVPNAQFSHGYPNKVKISIISDTVDWSRKPRKLFVQYSPVEKYSKDYTLQFTYDNDNEFWVRNLKPKTTYMFALQNENEAGKSNWSVPASYTTAFATVPLPPEILTKNSTKCTIPCLIKWTDSDDMGSPVLSYKVFIREILPVDGSNVPELNLITQNFESVDSTTMENKILLDQCETGKTYGATVVSRNVLGQSVPSKEIFFTVVSNYSLLMMSNVRWNIAMLFIAFVLIFIALIDLACYRFGRRGATAFICIKCCGKPSFSKIQQNEIKLSSNHVKHDGKSNKENGSTNINHSKINNDQSERSAMISRMSTTV